LLSQDIVVEEIDEADHQMWHVGYEDVGKKPLRITVAPICPWTQLVRNRDLRYFESLFPDGGKVYSFPCQEVGCDD
jgi:hypothetical protein